MLSNNSRKLTNRHRLFPRLLFWVAAEILLNYAGIDDLADYSEFLFERPIAAIHQDFTVG